MDGKKNKRALTAAEYMAAQRLNYAARFY